MSNIPVTRTRDLFGDQEAFEREMEARGLGAKYKDVLRRHKDRDAVNRSIRGKLFLQDLGYPAPDIERGRAKLDWAKRQQLPDASDEVFDQRAKEVVTREAARAELLTSAREEGFKSSLAEGTELEKWHEFAKGFPQVDQELRTQMFAEFRQGSGQLSDLQEVAPLSRKVFEFARDTTGFDPSDLEGGGQTLIEFADLPPEKVLKFAEAVAFMARNEGRAEDGPGALLKRFQRNMDAKFRGVGGHYKGEEVMRRVAAVEKADTLYFDFNASPKGDEDMILDVDVITEEEKARYDERGQTKSRWGKPIEWRQLTPEQVEETKKYAKLAKGYTVLSQAINEARASAVRLNEGSLIQGAAGVLVDTAAEMAGFISMPTAVAIGGTTIFQRLKSELRMRSPELEEHTLNSLAGSAATIEAGINRLQFLTLFRRIPGVSNKLARLGRGGKWTDWTMRAVAGTAAEVGQEFVQEHAMNAVLEVANVLDESLPDARFTEVTKAFGDQFWEMTLGMAPLVMLGAGIEINIDNKLARELAPFIGNRDLLRVSGMTDEEADRVLAEPESVRRAKLYREIQTGKTAEELGAVIEGVPDDVKLRAQAALRGPAEDPEITVTPEGKYRVTETGAEFATPDEAGAALAQFYEEELSLERQATTELLEGMEAAHDGLTVRDAPTREITVEDAIKAGQATMESFVERVEIEERQQGRPLSRDPSQFVVQGSNRLEVVDGVAQMVIDLNKGVLRPLVAAQEMGEVAMKRDLATGRHDRGFFIENLRYIERKTGKKIFATDDDSKITDQDLAEGVGEFTAAYAASEYDSDSIAPAFKAWLRKMLKAIQQVLRFAADVKTLRDNGELREDWETWTRQALGLDEAAIVEGEVGRVGAEIAGDAGVTFSIGRATIMPTAETITVKGSNATVIGPATFSIKAHHGTPHKIDPKEGFRLYRIGTGEGAQAYGYGLYFAESKDVAKSYADILAKDPEVYIDGKLEDPDSEDTDYYFAYDLKSFGLEKVLKTLDEDLARGALTQQSYNFKKSEFERLSTRDIEIRTDGRYIYTVRLKPEADEFLDWDKPLSEQSEKVRKAWASIEGSIKFDREAYSGRNLRGSEMYFFADPNIYGGQADNKRSRDKLLSAGIKGIRYLDGASRGKGEGSYNYVIFDEADIEIIEENGKPVSMEEAGGTSFSIRSINDPLFEAINAKLSGDYDKAEFAEKMLARLERVRERYDARRDAAMYAVDDDGNLIPPDRKRKAEIARTELLADIATMTAIRRSLPREIMGAIGQAETMAELKSTETRQKWLAERIDEVDRALTNFLLKNYKEKAGKLLHRSLGKKGESKTRKGTIGAAAHAFAQTAVKAQEMTADEATAKAIELEQAFNDKELDPTLDDFAVLDAQKRALDVFYDWNESFETREDPDTGEKVRVLMSTGVSLERARRAYEQLDDEYSAGRIQFIHTMMERRAELVQRVNELIPLTGAPVEVRNGADPERAAKGAEKQASKGRMSKLNEGFLQLIGSNHHKLARIVENAKDKDKARKWYYEMLDSRISSEVKTGQEINAKQDAYLAVVMQVIGAKGVAGKHKTRAFLIDAKKQRMSKITTLEGVRVSRREVPVAVAEGILAGTYWGPIGKDFDDADRAKMQEALEEYRERSDKQQARQNVITFERFSSAGARKPLGLLSQDDALGLWLTMRQPGQFAKLEAMGYDSQTMVELETFLDPKMRLIGLWMVADLKREGEVLTNIHREEYGISMPQLPNYFPVRNETREKAADLEEKAQSVQGGVTPGALKERQVNRAEPERAGAFASYLAHVTEMAYWKHNVKWVREWGGVLKDRRFGMAMKRYVSEKAYGEVTDYLETVERHGKRQADSLTDYERFMKTLLRRYSMGVLGLRASTVWINLTSFINVATTGIPVRKVLKNFATMWVAPNGHIKATWKNELQQYRLKTGASFEAQVAMSDSTSGSAIIQTLEKAAQYGLMPMNYADVGIGSLFLASIHKTVFDDAKGKGMTDPEAMEAADASVTRAVATVMQPTLNVSRSRMESAARSNPWYAMLTIFASETRKNLANNYVAWRTMITGKGVESRATAARQAFVLTLMQGGITMLFREIFKAATEDEEDEEFWERINDPKYWATGILTSQLPGVPVAGEIGDALIRETFDQPVYSRENPIAAAFKMAMRLPDKFEKLGDEDLTDDQRAEITRDLLEDSSRPVSLLPGAPILAELANIGLFADNVLSDEKILPNLEARHNVAPFHQAKQAREAIYESTKDTKDRHRQLLDAYRAIRDANPERWPRVSEMLKEKRLITKEIAEALD